MAGASVGAMLMLSISAPAFAVTENVQRETAHFIECLGWLISDPDRHAEECLPSNVPPVNSSLSSPVSGPPPVPEENNYDSQV
ncbi:MAG: hypothetical protein Q8L54_09210 [Devosia sp.]|nr:hypothetical protein [Devosia sp.]